jgi:heparin/heparan-sulfate lyase
MISPLRRYWKLALLIGCAITGIAGAADEWPDGIRPLDAIRAEHPRLFLSAADLPAIRARAAGPGRAEYTKLRRTVDNLPPEAPMIFREEFFTRLPDGTIQPDRPTRFGQQMFRYNGGDQAAQAALLYLIDGDRRDLEKAKNYLRLAGQVITWCAETAKRWVAWEAHVEINALAAYDWIYNDLTPEERRELLMPLLDYITKAQPEGEYQFRRTTGDYDTGNYGSRSLLWFAGVAAYGDGVDDLRAADFLRRGAALFFKMLDHRETISAGSGLLAALTNNYSFSSYANATLLFFFSWKSAYGEDISTRWPQMANYANWFDWSAIKILPDQPRFLTFGIGDTLHYDNLTTTQLIYSHLAQAIHFYAEPFPDKAAHAYAQLGRLSEKQRVFDGHYQFVPFLVTGFDPAKVSAAPAAAASGCYFFAPSFGLLLMRSGIGPDDTFAAFRGGSSQRVHQHYDELSFVIFKRNFLALDGGSRCETAHHHNFAAQSVAHNTLLIHQPEEPMPEFWHAWGYKPDGKTYFNHGGQNSVTAAKTIALQSAGDFIYIAADATQSYHEAKCREAVRQFVYLKPDCFVLYDRVESVTPEQRKEFLLHFQHRPVQLEPALWRADFEGRLFVRTLLPENAHFELVGGPGKEFFASGRNWPVVEPEDPDWDKKFQVTGKWRLETSDPETRTATRFLHLLEATLPENDRPLPAEKFRNETTDGIRFTDRAGTRWELEFNRTGTIGLRLRQTAADGTVRFEGKLPNAIEPRSGR